MSQIPPLIAAFLKEIDFICERKKCPFSHFVAKSATIADIFPTGGPPYLMGARFHRGCKVPSYCLFWNPLFYQNSNSTILRGEALATTTTHHRLDQAATLLIVFTRLTVLVTLAVGSLACGQDSNTTDWAGADRFDGRDPISNPYYSAPSERITWVGNVTSQADSVANADTARTDFGVNGSGIKIGVISDSYNTLGGEAAGIASGDLPGVGNPNGFLTPVTVLKDDNSGTDEGRAMVELIHDIAPGAELMFHSAFNNPGSAGSAPTTTIANAIDALRIAGADIIVDDVGILSGAKYQDGASAKAVEAAFAAGILYFSSAGNNGNNAYEAIQKSAAPAVGFNDLHDFNTVGDSDQILNLGVLNPGQEFRVTLWWNDPYASLGGTPTTDLSLLFVAINEAEGINAVIEENQDQFGGADPFEFGGITNPFDFPLEVGIAVERVAGDAAKLLSIEVVGQNIDDDSDTESGTIHGHNAAKGAVSVAAQFYADPGLDNVESFSSKGPTLFLFDELGNPLAEPEFRATPLITGIDGTDTSFFPSGPGADIEPNGFPNFFGTSAAAPHVAAIAALVMERTQNLGVSLEPDEFYELLFASTIDIETAGFDNLSGFGRLDANLALSQVRASLGDVNLDGTVDFDDIPAFISVLIGGEFQAEADCDENGVVDFSDIPSFIEILIAS